MNDGGHPPSLFAIDTSGRAVASARVIGVQNHDWEDLASFRRNGISYLLIADVGDNGRQADRYTLYIVEEPEVKAPTAALPAIRPRGTIRFQYEDGPRDCESVAVAPDLNRVFLISKRDDPPALYALDLIPRRRRTHVLAERITGIRNLPRPQLEEIAARPVLALVGGKPTAMDIAPDGLSALVLTYQEVYLYARKPRESWSAAFAREPFSLGLDRLAQAEAACFSNDGESVFITTEKIPAPLARISLKDKSPAFIHD
ncbi:MAG: hypothetical protein ACOWWM_05570 [Desulfobacterales bacterium]